MLVTEPELRKGKCKFILKTTGYIIITCVKTIQALTPNKSKNRGWVINKYIGESCNVIIKLTHVCIV